MLVKDSDTDSGLEGGDKGAVVDDEIVRDGRGLACPIVDRNALERVDGGGAGTLEVEEDELVADTPEVVGGGWFGDIESPITGLAVRDG
jgi:hypothetical protein